MLNQPRLTRFVPSHRCLAPLGAVALSLSIASGCAAAPSVVELERTEHGYQLIKNGEPYVIYGAGGTTALPLLKAYGGNTIRTWDAEGIAPLMDEAHELGISVWVGIWIAHQRHGYDHADPEQRRAQLERVERFVLEFRDHPALLGWGVGNELELEIVPVREDTTPDPTVVHIPEIDEHGFDDNEPTMVGAAPFSDDDLRAVIAQADDGDEEDGDLPALDITRTENMTDEVPRM